MALACLDSNLLALYERQAGGSMAQVLDGTPHCQRALLPHLVAAPSSPALCSMPVSLVQSTVVCISLLHA